MKQEYIYYAVTFRPVPGTRSEAWGPGRIAAACRLVWNRFLAGNKDASAEWKAGEPAGRPAVSLFSHGRAPTRFRKESGCLREPFPGIGLVCSGLAGLWNVQGPPWDQWRKSPASRIVRELPEPGKAPSQAMIRTFTHRACLSRRVR